VGFGLGIGCTIDFAMGEFLVCMVEL
jgi:hypothetical protein